MGYYESEVIANMPNRILTSIFSLVIIISVFPFTVYAQEDHVGYSVQASIPENQLDTKHSYFDLMMKPNQEQTLETTIFNNENEEINVRVSVYNAATNSNGLVVYEEQEEIDTSLKTPLTEILTVKEDIVTIPAGESKIVTAELVMPEEEYDGIILGGLHFEKMMDEEETTEGVSIQNKYAYVIGVQLSENDHEVFPDLQLKSVEPKLVNHRTAVVANIQNSKPMLMNDMTMHAKVYEKGKNETLKEKQQENIHMAPNSNMNVTIDWENEALKPGDYLLKVHATHDSETWEWEEEFTIEKSEATTLNKDAVELEDNGISYLWFAVGIAILIMIILGLLFYIKRLKKSHQLADNVNEEKRQGEGS